MTQPAVIITELDGSLGVLPPSSGRLLAVVGAATAGPLNTPATYARVRDLTNTFQGGPAVEAAAYHINATGRPVVFVRTDTPVAGTADPIESIPLGSTSVVTIDNPLPAGVPYDDFDIIFLVVAGGTIGTAGITYKLSLDHGRSYGPVMALGTATSVEVPETGGVTFSFGTGTLVAGAKFGARTTAPNFDADSLKDALDALGASAVQWEIAELVGPLAVDTFDVVEASMASLFAAGKYRSWVGHARVSEFLETEAEYLDDLSTVFADSATKFGSLYAGACWLTSAVSGRKYRRPVSFATASREQNSSEEVDIADVNIGPLLGCAIADANGNPLEHDESINPGLDDARFGTLRTWDGLSGVYVNRPRLFSTEGSDFVLMPHRRVLNLAHNALRMYFIRRLNKPIRVDAATGFILESEALEIETGAVAAMTAALMAKPKASAVQFTLSRVDNVLSTQTLTGQARVIPLAYPEFINLEVGFFNPALVVQAA